MTLTGLVKEHISNLIFCPSLPPILPCIYTDLCVVPQIQQSHPPAWCSVLALHRAQNHHPRDFPWSAPWSLFRCNLIGDGFPDSTCTLTIITLCCPALLLFLPPSTNHYLTYLFVHSICGLHLTVSMQAPQKKWFCFIHCCSLTTQRKE